MSDSAYPRFFLGFLLALFYGLARRGDGGTESARRWYCGRPLEQREAKGRDFEEGVCIEGNWRIGVRYKRELESCW